MLIGIDCGCLGLKNQRDAGGIYNVTKVLLEAIGKLDKKNKYLLYSFHPIDKKLMKSFGKNRTNMVVTPRRGWMSFAMPLKINQDRPDIFIGMSQAIPRRFPFLYYPKTVTLFYDLGFEKMPQMYKVFPKKLKANSRRAARNSDILITTSDNSKKDITILYGVKSNKIKVAYPNVSNIFKQKGGKFKNKNPYFLFVGAFKPTKNVTGIIKGFLEFSKLNPNYDLVLVGGGNIESKNKRIKTLGFVAEEKLASLYRGALAFVSPSFYEGFGMTFLEAMRCGCPIITSDKGSIPEIVKDRAIIVNPKDYKAITQAMLKVSKDKNKRSRLIKKGIRASKEFSSKKFAGEVLDIINSL